MAGEGAVEATTMADRVTTKDTKSITNTIIEVMPVITGIITEWITIITIPNAIIDMRRGITSNIDPIIAAIPDTVTECIFPFMILTLPLDSAQADTVRW